MERRSITQGTLSRLRRFTLSPRGPSLACGDSPCPAPPCCMLLEPRLNRLVIPGRC